MSRQPPPLQLSGAHALSSVALQEQLAVNLERGLSAGEALERLHRCGANRLTARQERPLWQQFLAQFHAPSSTPC